MRSASNLEAVKRSGSVVGMSALVACLLLGASCTGKSAAKTPSTTAASTVPPSPTTTDPRLAPIDQVPEVITVEYVQRVMDALDHLEGELTRKLVRDRVPSLEFRQMLTALYDEPAFSKAEASFGRDAAHSLDVYVDQPGDPTTRVNRVLASSSSCVTVDVDRDLGPQLKRKPTPDELSAVIILRPKKVERDPLHVNPTYWSMTANGSPAPGANLERACG